AVDGLRSYYLAQAGVERGILYVEWELENTVPPNLPFRYSPANPVLPFTFPSGQAVVQVIPETAKLNLNSALPDHLLRLLVALGAEPDRAAQIVAGIVDWRSPGGMSQFDSFYMSLTPSFRSRHASFEETEELLLVRGITPELYYGGYDRDTQGRLVPRAGLRDCVTVLNRVDGIDVNTAQPAVLMAIGIPPDAAAAIVARRSQQPFKNTGEVGGFAPGGGEAYARLRVGGKGIYTFRSTARVSLPNGQFSDLRRTVAATVSFGRPDDRTRVDVLRWYDNAWTP
ncbi:MAG TPA: type II secretion system protein GspK, partial [Bryobacteraceae bacterium]|nr:type II secretion system protein GspK [Bryobacteraceae bacterium]